MKSKTEEKLDKEFEKLKIRPKIYHFVGNVYPYKAITVAMDNKELIIPLLTHWENVLGIVGSAIDYAFTYNHNRTTELIKQLKTKNIYGISICDIRDEFSRKQGRTIAKGRLLKYLRDEKFLKRMKGKGFKPEK